MAKKKVDTKGEAVVFKKGNGIACRKPLFFRGGSVELPVGVHIAGRGKHQMTGIHVFFVVNFGDSGQDHHLLGPGEFSHRPGCRPRHRQGHGKAVGPGAVPGQTHFRETDQ